MRASLLVPLFHRGLKGKSLDVKRLFSMKQKISPDWELASAVCLERKPIVSKDSNFIEKKHDKLIRKEEVEMSFLSNHEIKHSKDLKRAEKLKEEGESKDSSLSNLETAQDFEDQCNKELNDFCPASRVTGILKADVINNHNCVSRELDSSLFLILRLKLGNDLKWIFPQAFNIVGEDLRQTAERAVRESCGNDITVQFMGNAPVGYYSYKYPKIMRKNNVLGAKIFFFKAHLLKGSISESRGATNFQWLNQRELSCVLPSIYYKSVEVFVFPNK